MFHWYPIVVDMSTGANAIVVSEMTVPRGPHKSVRYND